MDVHKPKPFHNWREFLKEYAIIVVGVLTALFADQAVQSIDWQHKVDAAIADMDNELGVADGPQAYARLAIHDCLTTRLSVLRQAVERGDRIQSRMIIDSLGLPNRTYDSLAREAATASDVASHMPPQRMLQYRAPYEVVPEMDRLADRELIDLGHLRALPAVGGQLETREKLAENDAVEALRLDDDAISREARFLLKNIGRIGLRLDRGFVGRDLGDVRPYYGGCLNLAPKL
jgi:hypothetical protein